MLKAALAALLLASPILPPSPGAAPVPSSKVAPAPSAPDDDHPDIQSLLVMAKQLAEGPVSKVEGQPMHLKALLPGRQSDGRLALLVFENADGSLVTALAALWKNGAWASVEVFRS